MGKKNKNDKHGFVYSTDPGFKFDEESPLNTTPKPGEQKLIVRLDTKHRAGKAVSLIEGFEGKEEDLQQLGKDLKSHCGTGGSAKNGEIIIQGDHRQKLLQWLVKNGYRQSKLR
jgi:translation initiation factor 1